MGTCVCGSPIGLVPRACRIEDHALLWPPVRVNADGTEHRCRKPERRPVRIVEPVPAAVQAALLNAQASQGASAAVERLASVLADESQARQDFYRQRAGRGSSPAPRPSTTGAPIPAVASEGGALTAPAATYRTLAEELELEGEAG